MTCRFCPCVQARVRKAWSYDAIYRLDRDTETAAVWVDNIPCEVPAMKPYNGLHGEIHDGVLVIMESGAHCGERFQIVSAKTKVA